MDCIPLSPSFYLDEFMRSQIAARLCRQVVVGRDAQAFRDLRLRVR